MTMKPRPGNQPDTDDMSDPLVSDGEGANPGTTRPVPEADEEEADRLGNFA